ncbi:MAG TPA: hypothetical protein VKB35_14085 [Ktedonobacteraceae bacterium]|nr:hypothetical protein [Ktedonobacteraceae bacterium]
MIGPHRAVAGRNELHPYKHSLLVLCTLVALLTACSSGPSGPASSSTRHTTISTTGGNTITYNNGPQDVLIRTFYGGGKLGTLEMSPDITIYGDGAYILGPGLQMRQGKLSVDALQQLLFTLVDNYALLKLNRQQFYDLPDQNATVLQLNINDQADAFLYGPFGNLQESAQDLEEYQRLGKALTSITGTLSGPTNNYTSNQMALLVHQTFSQDLNQTIPPWDFQGFTLAQLANYECGPVPPDETGPNADTGCLTFTVPQKALLLDTQQLQQIVKLLQGQDQGTFLENGLYYSVVLRPLLPDEIAQKMLAMFGSQELAYAGVPLHQGPVPTLTPTP